jgi:hypothetical protein
MCEGMKGKRSIDSFPADCIGTVVENDESYDAFRGLLCRLCGYISFNVTSRTVEVDSSCLLSQSMAPNHPHSTTPSLNPICEAAQIFDRRKQIYIHPKVRNHEMQ